LGEIEKGCGQARILWLSDKQCSTFCGRRATRYFGLVKTLILLLNWQLLSTPQIPHILGQGIRLLNKTITTLHTIMKKNEIRLQYAQKCLLLKKKEKRNHPNLDTPTLLLHFLGFAKFGTTWDRQPREKI